MQIRVRRGVVLLAAAAVVAAPAPALAQEPVSAEVQHVPAALAGDLSSAEEHTLSDLTAGHGVRLSALVDTPHGPQITSFDAGSRADAAAAVSLLDAQPSVQAAGVAGTMRAASGAYEQYGNVMVRADAARALVDRPLSDVVVAVLDTGVGPHPELDSALLPGHNFTDSGGPTDTTDRYGHGTHVAGTIGADAGSLVEGVAAGVRILPVKVLDDAGVGYSDWVASGIVWAADHGADVINMSLGGPSPDDLIPAAIAYARSKGVTVVAAAGNADSSAPSYPAADDGVIAVSAVDAQEAKAGFSNYGSYVDVAAPGVNILSTYPGGRYAYMSGTSMASPHVAAIAALDRAVGPDLTPDQIELALESTATDLGAPGRDDVYGRGLVDAVRSVQAAKALEATDQQRGNHPPVAPDLAVTSRQTPDHLVIDVLAGASDPDGDALALSSFTQPARGVVLRDGRQLAYEPAGSGPFTDSFTYTVADPFGATATGTVHVTVVAPAAPGAPGLASISPGNGSVTVRWVAPTDAGTAPVTRYVVQAYTGRTLVRSVTAAASARSLGVTGLANGRAYTVSVAAVNAVGTGPASARSAAVVPRTVPGAPRIGRASAGHRSVVVRWAAPTSNGGAAISSYVVRTYRGAALLRSTTVPARIAAISVGGLAPGVAYTFRVVAINAAGTSPASAAVTVRPAR